MNFYLTTIRRDPRFRSLETVRDLMLLEPVTRAAVSAIIADALAEGIRLGVSETYRSRELQRQCFELGTSKLADVGPHHFGLAADFYKIDDRGKASWAGDWGFLARLAGKHGLISGIDWGHPKEKHTFCDRDHVQRVRLQDQPALFAGRWYPDFGYGALPDEAPTETGVTLNA